MIKLFGKLILKGSNIFMFPSPLNITLKLIASDVFKLVLSISDLILNFLLRGSGPNFFKKEI